MSHDLAVSIEEGRLSDPTKICRALFLSAHGHSSSWMMFYHDDKAKRQVARQFESMVGAEAYESALLTLRPSHLGQMEVYAPSGDIPGWTVHISANDGASSSGYASSLAGALGAALAKALTQ